MGRTLSGFAVHLSSQLPLCGGFKLHCTRLWVQLSRFRSLSRKKDQRLGSTHHQSRAVTCSELYNKIDVVYHNCSDLPATVTTPAKRITPLHVPQTHSICERQDHDYGDHVMEFPEIFMRTRLMVMYAASSFGGPVTRLRSSLNNWNRLNLWSTNNQALSLVMHSRAQQRWWIFTWIQETIWYLMRTLHALTSGPMQECGIYLRFWQVSATSRQ